MKVAQLLLLWLSSVCSGDIAHGPTGRDPCYATLGCCSAGNSTIHDVAAQMMIIFYLPADYFAAPVYSYVVRMLGQKPYNFSDKVETEHCQENEKH